MNSILVVDDDEVFRKRLVKAFEDRGLQAFSASNIEQAKHFSKSADLAVIDLRLADESGLDALKSLKEISPKTQIVMLTGYGSIANALEATKLGAINYLSKPANADEILAAFNETKPSNISAPPSLARAEWEHIQRVLADCGGNISHAAKQLGLPRRSLQRKLSKLPPKG